MTRAPNPEQAAAIGARGDVFVSAGAGTGKTTVLVERFTEAVCERGLDVDSLLVITYTERAAGELRSRIRERLAEVGRRDLARELDGAWISTIHGFCLRLLKAHPFAAGLDPRFRVLDDSQGRVLRSEAFESALSAFCADGRPDRLRLLATYGTSGLRRMLTSVYETLRSAGRELVLELGGRPSLEERLAELREAASCLAEDTSATELQRAAAAAAGELPARAEALVDLSALRARGERAAGYEEARKAVEQAALDELAARDRELLQELLQAFATAYAEAKDRESALDFEDLQLRARDLLRDQPEIREREALRFRSIMVDEFQDTNRLQCELIDLLVADAAGQEVLFVGDEFQSIYGFRHADVGVFRERREAASNLLALMRNYRSRPEVLAVVNHLFGPTSARASSRSRRPASSPTPSSARRSSSSSPTSSRTRTAARTGAARRRGTSPVASASSSTRERPSRARSSCSSLPEPTRSGTRTSFVPPGCRPIAPRARATSASSRSSTCSRTCACSTTATTTRRC